MSVLVTGATGFIGGAFVRRLLEDGAEVHALIRTRPANAKPMEGVRIHPYNGKADEIYQAIQTARPRTVFHFASLFLAEHSFEQIPDLIDSNLNFATQLVDAMVRNGCHSLVSAGTSWQNFADTKGLPTNLYAATKEAFEVILRYYVSAFGLNAIVLKLYDTYGPHDRRRKLLSVLREAALSRKPLGLSAGEQMIDLLHVDDAVSAFQSAAARIEARPGGLEEFYLRSGRRLSLKDLVTLYGQVTGRVINAKWGERPYRAREVMNPWQEGPTLPGWNPRIGLETGLKDYANEVS